MTTRRLLRRIAIAAASILPIGSPGQQSDERLGLPPLAIPAGNPVTPAKVALGERLFFDKRLSADGSVSCASCHQPERAFSDGLTRSQGIGKRVGTRNAPSVLNAALLDSQFWDGRQPTLEAQALDPLVNPKEHGLTDHTRLVQIIRGDPPYTDAFHKAFGIDPEAIEKEHVAQALASFERTLVVGNSAFDRYYFGGDKRALSPASVRGLELFMGRAQCATCHLIGKHSAAFTDNQFHSLHVGMSRIDGYLAELTTRVVALRKEGRPIDATVISDEDIAELGRFAITLDPHDIGTFRTPSLRNVDLTAPYMHDGSVVTLEEAVNQELYYRTAQIGRPLILTPREKMDLVAFLKGLTSKQALGFRAHY